MCVYFFSVITYEFRSPKLALGIFYDKWYNYILPFCSCVSSCACVLVFMCVYDLVCACLCVCSCEYVLVFVLAQNDALARKWPQMWTKHEDKKWNPAVRGEECQNVTFLSSDGENKIIHFIFITGLTRSICFSISFLVRLYFITSGVYI